MKKLLLLLLFIPLVFSCSNNSTKYSGDFEYPISDYWIFNEDGGNSENPTSMLALKFNYMKKLILLLLFIPLASFLIKEY